MANVVKAKLARQAALGPQKKVKLKIKKGDRVLVISGAYRGETGRVIEVLPKEGVVRVEGIRMVKKHQKPDRQRNIRGGITEMEAPIDISNVKLIDPVTGKASRVGRQVQADGSIVRVCKKTGTVLGAKEA